MIKACVIGWPIEHSRSPMIHGYWLRKHRINGSYEKVAVAPEDIESFLSSLGAQGFAGCNVTLPHKEAALRAADNVHAAARSIGAANTLWLSEDGRLEADNTDAYGFMTHLKESAPSLRLQGATAMLLGAGGAARAILYGLQKAGVERIVIANRTEARAAALAEAFDHGLETIAWDKAEGALKDCDLLVNTTSLGMDGQPPLEMSLKTLPKESVVADIVYTPLETPLLAEARARGNACVDGLGMLLHQAVPGFERWFGVRPEVTKELRDLVVADLKVEDG
ncbi:shikimate dehydrogenase [Methyloligella solikamskensis]|uniref:Shikimate dehydrogenase (NADP(+)) n=1 Tax=Methyloligella solikamskensis TaxID=1177756 RepID=A0ABW3J6T6_9HYPH